VSRIKYFLALILCFASLSHAAVAYVDVKSNSGGSVNTLSAASITPTGSNRLVAAVACIDQYPAVNFTGMTYGGAAMTQIANYGNVQGYFRCYAAYIIAPSTGGGVVTVNLDGSAVTIYLAAIAYSGVDQSTPVGTAVTGNGADGHATLTISSNSGDMVMDGTVGFGGTLTKTGSGTSRDQVAGIVPDNIAAGVSTIAGASSVVQSWTFSDSYSWASVGFNILQAGGSGAPVITVDPSNATVLAPATTTFSITATNSPTSYQWRKNGSNVSGGSGGTTASYTIPASALADNGATFDCIATNAFGSDTSATATLTVHQIPIITVDPANRTVASGATAAFSETHTGTAPYTYQWQRSPALDVCSATSSTFVTQATTPSYNGRMYRVIVTNAYGADTSGYATLTITTGPGQNIWKWLYFPRYHH
jgi:hypothetical protein